MQLLHLPPELIIAIFEAIALSRHFKRLMRLRLTFAGHFKFFVEYVIFSRPLPQFVLDAIWRETPHRDAHPFHLEHLVHQAAVARGSRDHFGRIQRAAVDLCEKDGDVGQDALMETLKSLCRLSFRFVPSWFLREQFSQNHSSESAEPSPEDLEVDLCVAAIYLGRRAHVEQLIAQGWKFCDWDSDKSDVRSNVFGSAFIAATLRGDVSMMLLLLSSNPNYNPSETIPFRLRENILTHAAWYGHKEAFDFAIDSGPFGVNKGDVKIRKYTSNNLLTPEYALVRRGVESTPIVDNYRRGLALLLPHNSTAPMDFNDSRWALSNSASKGHIDMVQYLLDSGGSPIPNRKHANKPLQRAVSTTRSRDRSNAFGNEGIHSIDIYLSSESITPNLPLPVRPVYPSPEKHTVPDIDIIAIHGLDTKSPDTWEYKTKTSRVNWLTHKHMLPEKVGNARIWTCNWPAELFQESLQTTLEESAESLRNSIIRHLEGDSDARQERPILFIASCLGGIILLKALDLDLSRNNKDHPSLISATRGIVFLATPFGGTAFTGMPDWELTAWASLNGKEVTALIDYTKRSTELDSLVGKFLRLANDKEYHVWTFWEAGKTSLLSKLYLGWAFSERIHFAWFLIVILSRYQKAFSPWLPVALWALWSKYLPIFKPTPLVDRISANARVLDSDRLDRPHILMNKFDHCKHCEHCDSSSPSKHCEHSDCDTCNNDDYSKVSKKIEEILGKIRKERTIDKADAYIRNKHYTEERLKIQRLSGGLLSMTDCYINLATIKDLSRDAAYSKKDRSSPFTLASRLKIETPNEEFRVELAKVFDKGPDGTLTHPRRILIRGRAGIGKTTLCKKMVYDFVNDNDHAWRNIFDRILWIPLRKLKKMPPKGYTLTGLFRQHFFSDNTLDGESFARELGKELDRTECARTLFVLDGLDEISEGLSENSQIHSILEQLLNQPHIIVTSRPFALLPRYFHHSLELETIGFYPNQVQEYLEKISPQANQIQSFLRKRPLIQGLVRIPIQLDALCLAWADQGSNNNEIETMTALYNNISDHLWKRESQRFDKQPEINALTAGPVQIRIDHGAIMEFLECLAFNGMYSNIIEFQPDHLDVIKEIRSDVSQWLGKRNWGDVSFLRTSDPLAGESDRSYHFLHLTYQEFFAARYFARQWQNKKKVEIFKRFEKKKGGHTKVSVETFLQENKYNIRYDIVWRFTVGLLEHHEVPLFFDALEQPPLDLLGPTHQRLVMHCLSEVTHWKGQRRHALELRLSQWMSVEDEMTRWSLLVLEPEFPDGALRTALGVGSSADFSADSIMRWCNILFVLGSHGRYFSDGVFEILMAILKNEDYGITRSTAIEALSWQTNLPNTVYAALVAALKDKDEEVRYSAASLLCKQSIPTNTTVLMEIFKNKNAHRDRRSEAGNNLKFNSSLLDPDIATLFEVLREKEENIGLRFLAADILHCQSSLPVATVTALIAILKDESEDESSQSIASSALGQKLPEAILKDLVAIIGGKNERQDTVFYWHGSGLSPRAIRRIKTQHIRSKRHIRSKAAEVLARQSSLSQSVIADLAVLLYDENENIRSNAVRALAEQPSLSETIITTLIDLLRDQNLESRTYKVILEIFKGQLSLPEHTLTALVEVLRARSGEGKETVAEILKEKRLPKSTIMALVELLDDQDEDVRFGAANALTYQSNLPGATLPALVGMLKARNEKNKTAIIIILRGQNLPKSIVADLVTMLIYEDEETRLDAANALGDQSNLPEAALIALVEVLKIKGWACRQNIAAQILKRHGSLLPSTITALTTVLEDEDEDVRLSATNVLENQSSLPEATLIALLEVLKIENWKGRKTASQILNKHRSLPMSVIAGLVPRLEGENETDKLFAAYALENQLSFNEPTIMSIVARLKDDVEDVQSIVAEILEKQLNLSGATIKILMSVLEKEVESAQFAVAERLGKHPKLLDKIFMTSKFLFETGKGSESLNFEMITVFYISLIYRSFGEQFCTYVEGDHLVISLPSGLQKFKVSPAKILAAVQRARQQYFGALGDMLWTNPPEKATARRKKPGRRARKHKS
ncbi:hypothetical protein F5Y12DRAFT_716901 [Xylaria sp. FL1777]|nr:hypothetical protein F5Y12DRAFT_716901 [Xylaria sp. FL1777]